MKKNDLAVVIAVAFFAGIFALILSNIIITPSNNKNLKAQKIDAISSDFNQVDKRFFNSESLNPTQIIQIGDGQNKTQ